MSMTVPALPVKQWLEDWDDIHFDASHHRGKPEPRFYVFSLDADILKRLSGVQRRTTDHLVARAADLGIQRRHDAKRSLEIGRFLRYGSVIADKTNADKIAELSPDLCKPGWLPTAIVVNVLKPGAHRGSHVLAPEDAVVVDYKEGGAFAEITLPDRSDTPDWRPNDLRPIEVIDGQHRLFAFDEASHTAGYQLPVVAFLDLDISWQAYLFWTINIKPKKIGPSLAFDLYPLLRTEDWLERFQGPEVYRQARAQELVDALWRHEQSPWLNRINMLGVPGEKPRLSQAAWVRSLVATYVKSYEHPSAKLGGLFGAPVNADETALPWSFPMQAAFLICAWRYIWDAVASLTDEAGNWAHELGLSVRTEGDAPPAVFGPHALLCQDPGVRAVLQVTNDLCYVKAGALGLDEWDADEDASGEPMERISVAIMSLRQQRVCGFLQEIAARVVSLYDWRSFGAPGVPVDQENEKASLRGSGGYSIIRRRLLELLCQTDGPVGEAAVEAAARLGY